MRELFIATSYHHVMTAIAKKRKNNSEMDILISNFSTGDEYWQNILEGLKESGWFENIFYIDERKYHPPKPNRFKETIVYERRYEEEIIKLVPGFDVDKYDLIYMIDDKMFPAATIIKRGRPFHLCEDTAYTFQLMNECGSSKIMKTPYRIIQKCLRILHYWHPVFGYADCCIAIEASSREGLPSQMPMNKVIVEDRGKLIESIPQEDKTKLCKLFLKEEDLEIMFNAKNIVVIMTSLYRRGNQIAEEQIRICKKVMELYENKKFFIKPHPRDLTDYKEAFPDAYVLNARFPSELLNYFDEIMFEEAVSVGSTAVNTCKYAMRTKYLSLADIGEKIPYEEN
jgi:uncharacterized protein (UPF0248 family)